jgi:hypothetical protein
MRTFSALTCFSLCISVGFGAESDPAQPPPIAIVKHAWYVDSGLLRDYCSAASDASVLQPASPVPGAYNPPSPRLNPSRTLVVPPLNGESSEQPKTRDVFRYEVTLRNESGKPIRRIFWSYDFLNPETNAIVSRNRFETDTKINPGKSKRIEGVTNHPPSTVSSVHVLKREPGWEKSERVVVFRIQFADGTFWSRRRAAQPFP